MAEAQSNATENHTLQKPSVLIIGGLGYIGRFLAKHIHTHQLASYVRIVDKVLPQLAHLAPEFQDPCSPSIFLQADASRETSLARIFDTPSGRPFDYVFNLGGETAWSQTSEIYKLRTTNLSTNLAHEAARRQIRAFVETSTGMVYAPHSKPRVETDKLKPWLKLSKAKLEAEQLISHIPHLNLVILRLAHVYGPYDRGFVAKALCLARVYQEQQRELKWLWTEDLRINTVHVEDVARALWQTAEWRAAQPTNGHPTPNEPPTSPTRRTTLLGGNSGEEPPLPGTPIFNIVDHGHTSQGTLASIISTVFSIRTGFQGSLISQFAKLNLESVVDDLNEEILQPWADMCKAKQVLHGPLSPFLEKELLRDTDLSLDGLLFEKTTGFKYEREKGLDVAGVQEMVGSYERMGWWP